MGPLNMLVCGSCLTLMFFESAFGICLGCKLYNLFNKEQAQLCPGGVCEVPVRAGWGLKLSEMAVMVLFAGVVVLASRWVDATGGPMGGFDEMATVEEMGLSRVFWRGGIGRRRPLHPALLRRVDGPRREVEAAQPLPMI